MSGPRPTQLTLHQASHILEIAFDDGSGYRLPCEYLRVESPSAEVKGHGGQRQTVAGKRGLKIARLEPVGNYAVRIVFDDLHDSGIYSWDYLHQLGAEQAERWAAYEAELAAKGLSRDPPRRRH